MSDILDVQNALVSLIAQALFPNGTGQPSVVDAPIVVYPGWPDPTTLDTDIGNGKAHVTVFPKPEERNTTRYPIAQQVVTQANATLTLTVAGQIITVGGTVSTPQNLAVLVGAQAYTYAVQTNDTLTSIATALATMIAVAGTTSSGNVVTVGPTGEIRAARVGANGTVAAEYRRQEKVILVTVWASTPALRYAIGAALDVALAQIEFITLPDGFGGRLTYKSSNISDALAKTTIYRRDLSYCVEYATTVTTPATQITVQQINLTGGIDPTHPVIETVNL